MKKLIPYFLVLPLLFVACQDDEPLPVDQDTYAIDAPSPMDAYIGDLESSNARKAGSENQVLLYMAEYITSGEGDEIGRTVFFSNRGNKQLGGDFVPSLLLSLDGTTDITYYTDENRPTADMGVGVSTAAIQRAMATWDGVTCSDLGMTNVPFDGRDTGFVPALFDDLFGTSFGGSFDYVADVIHNGWMPGAFFDFLAPGGSNFILGVTFTIIFVDGAGNPVDTDNNKKFDVAWREIYYNDNFPWNDGSIFDVETVALHEAGHGLSQGHFGGAFGTNKNGKIHFNPRAVMNAAYSGVQTDISRTDNGGHCSNWAQWPNN